MTVLRERIRRLLRTVLLAGLACVGAHALAAEKFSFGFVAPAFDDILAGESVLASTLAATDRANLAFLVAGGLKSARESCSDALYEQRHVLLNGSQHGVVLAVSGDDWGDCHYRDGRSAALERLRRLREVFFADDLSLGASRIPLIRQSATARFRDYAENMRWSMGGIMFATLNLPADNNRYLIAAGRNGEFEDRLVANRDWLQRVFKYAQREKSAGIVLFSDGDMLRTPRADNPRRDGFLEMRKLIADLSADYEGTVLLVHNAPAQRGETGRLAIRWQGRLGNLGVAAGWADIRVTPGEPALFEAKAGARCADEGQCSGTLRN